MLNSMNIFLCNCKEKAKNNKKLKSLLKTPNFFTFNFNEHVLHNEG